MKTIGIRYIGGIYMRITDLEIQNFRGIKESNISFPSDSRIICLIGAGDSTKSTLLKAIEWLFWPTWSLTISDADFYRDDPTNPIVIRGTFSEFPDKLIAEDKFGMYLRRPCVEYKENVNDEPLDDKPLCLTIQLTIDASLDPKWEIVCNRLEPRLITYNDRKQLFVGVIGDNTSKDLVWGKYSVLQKYADSKHVLHEAYTAAVREAAKNADLSELDKVTATLSDVGRKLGVGFDSEIKNRLLVQGSSFSTTVGLFDGDAPLCQFGTGSQRLLSIGLNIGATSGEALLLIDEVENGLEPFRLRNLINEFRTDHSTTGQVIMTTHSPVAVSECSIGELMIVHSNAGRTNALIIQTGDKDADNTIQRQIRGNAEAYLCKRLIVCEGKTEMGFVRALDTYLSKTQHRRIAFNGVGTADGGGSSIFKCADIFQKCGYQICLLMDSDKESEDAAKKQILREQGIYVFNWAEPNAFEEQVFLDLPLLGVQEAIEIAVTEKGIESVAAKLQSNSIPFEQHDNSIQLYKLNKDQRKTIGTIAKGNGKDKDNGWFKRIGLGEQLGRIVFKYWDEISEESILKCEVSQLIDWVMHNDTSRA